MQLIPLLVPGLIACGTDAAKDASSTEDTSSPMEFLFSFAVVADPHIAGPVEHEERLQVVVDWLNAQAGERGCELVLVVGDIGWSSGIERSRELLDGLAIPYVPLVGDNEVAMGDAAAFHEVFAPQYESLAQLLDGWDMAPMPVLHPDTGEDAWLQNLRFEHGGLLFVGTDNIIRGLTGNLAEFGTLNDYEGGTWPFLAEALEGVDARPEESVVLAGHVPLMWGMLDDAEVAAVEDLIGPVGDYVHGHYSGHLHMDHYEEVLDAGYEVHVTDAAWDDEITLRMVEVSGNGYRMAYEQDLVVLDWEESD